MDDPFGDDDDLFRDDFFAELDKVVAQHVKNPAQDQQNGSQVLPHQPAVPLAPLARAVNPPSSHAQAGHQYHRPSGPSGPPSSRQWQQPKTPRRGIGAKPARTGQLQLQTSPPPQEAAPASTAQNARPAWEAAGPSHSAHPPASGHGAQYGAFPQQQKVPGGKQGQTDVQMHHSAPASAAGGAQNGGVARAGSNAAPHAWDQPARPPWGTSAAGVLETPPVERTQRRSLRELFSKDRGGGRPGGPSVLQTSGPGPLNEQLVSSNGAGSMLAAMETHPAPPGAGYESYSGAVGSNAIPSNGPGSGVSSAGLSAGQLVDPQDVPGGVIGNGLPQGRVTQAATSALLQAQLDGHVGSSASGGAPDPGKPDEDMHVNHTQHELTHLRERLASQEGNLSIVRSKLEASEREKADLQRRLAQAANQTAAAPAAFGLSPADMQLQIHTLQEQLTFKEQEIMEEKRKHVERSERLRDAEAKAEQLRADMLKAEGMRAMLEQELGGVQMERKSRTLEASPRQSTTPRLAAGKATASQQLPRREGPPSTRKRQLEAGPAFHQPENQVSAAQVPDRRSGAANATSAAGPLQIGQMTIPTAAQEPPLPAWELPLPMNHRLGGSDWQHLWESAGEHLSVLLVGPDLRCSDSSLAGPDPLVPSDVSSAPRSLQQARLGSQPVHSHLPNVRQALHSAASKLRPGKEAWQAAVQEHLHSLAHNDAAAPQLLASLAQYLACWLTADPEGPQTTSSRRLASRALMLPGRDEKEAAAARQAASARSLQAGLHSMRGLLDSSEAARQLAVASCHPPATTAEAIDRQNMESVGAGERAGPSEGEAPLDARLAPLLARVSSRVAITSKGRVLRARGRLKDKPPDEAALRTLRCLPLDNTKGGGSGLLRLLLRLLQHEVGAEGDVSPAASSTMQAVLSALLGLVAFASANSGRHIMLPLIVTGNLDSLVQRPQPEWHPALLSILQQLLQDHKLCRVWEARIQSHSTQPMAIDAGDAAAGPSADPRGDQDGCTLLELPLLCLAGPAVFSGRTGSTDGARSGEGQAIHRQALAVLAQLLECRRFSLLQHLLGEQPGLGLAPLSQQLLARVQDALGGGLLNSKERVRIAVGPLEWQQRLRLVQEALLLLRGMLGETLLAAAVLDDLTATSTTQRACLAILLRVANWQPPLDALRREVCEPEFLLAPQTALAPWAMALGQRYCGRELYNTGGVLPPPACLSEVVYLAKSIKRRVLHRLEHAMQG